MWVRLLFLPLFFLSFISFALCQPPNRPPDSGRRSFFEFAWEKVRHASPNREVLHLAFHPPIRNEINLEDDKFELLKSALSFDAVGMSDLVNQFRDGSLTAEELGEEMTKRMQEADKKARELLDKAQFERLIGLYVQQNGVQAAGNAAVAEMIGLEGDELEQFRDSRSKYRRELMDQNRDEMQRILRHRDEHTSGKIERLFTEGHTSLNSRLTHILSDEQKAELEKLKGDAFDDLPPRRFGRGGPPGRGGRGGRPGGDRERRRGSDGRGNPDSHDAQGPDRHGRGGRPGGESASGDRPR